MTANQGSTTMRNVPDVSLVANNITIFWGNTYLGLGAGGGNSYPFQVTGTSLATPLWAGFVALVNQQAAANSQPPIGFVNPALYAIGKSTNYASCFNDIITGCNTNSLSPTKYSATAGYDLCTGWGSMNGDNLLPALLSPPLDNLRITSPLGFISQGTSGGPFSVTSQTYTLLNTGTAPLTWSLVNTSSWLNVSATGGTLNPGSSTTVTVSINTNANSFLINHASGNVTFSNLTSRRQLRIVSSTCMSAMVVLKPATSLSGRSLATRFSTSRSRTTTQMLPEQMLFRAYRMSCLCIPESGALTLANGPNGEPPNGTLSQTIPTVAGQQLLVSFWLTSIPDEQNDPPTNGFAAFWNGSTLFKQTNVTVSVWTNMQYIVSSSGSSGTLQFEFNNTPGAFGLDDVTVTIASPSFQSVALSGTNVLLTWPVSAASFQLQSNTNLSSTNWVTITPVLSTNGSAVSTLVPRSGSQDFFRLKQ